MRATQTRTLASAMSAVLLAACAASACSGSPGASTCPTPAPAPAADLALLPGRLSLRDIATVTRVVREGAHVTAFGVTSLRLEEATVRLQDAVVAAGYRPAGMDNEGFEAEVFFTAGSYAAGQALLRPAECDGQWDLELTLLEPDAVPTPTPRASGTATTPAPAGTTTEG